MDCAVSADLKVKIEENEKVPGSCQRAENVLELGSDCDTNCSWSSWNTDQLHTSLDNSRISLFRVQTNYEQLYILQALQSFLKYSHKIILHFYYSWEKSDLIYLYQFLFSFFFFLFFFSNKKKLQHKSSVSNPQRVIFQTIIFYFDKNWVLNYCILNCMFWKLSFKNCWKKLIKSNQKIRQ